MKNPRVYGQGPYGVAVVHGGPGAAGQMAEVATELSRDRGILEPLQTEKTIDGQVRELKAILERNGNPPLTLIGHSWGAWLSFILAARHPEMVSRLILVGPGPFREQDARYIPVVRLQRLEPGSRSEALDLMNRLSNQAEGDKDEIMKRLGSLFFKADAFDPMEYEMDGVDVRFDIHQPVWSEASELRRSGKLLDHGKRISCPVVAIHGDHDPHPATGVERSLGKVLGNFRFVLLSRCGHVPWREKRARDTFFRILRENLNEDST